MSRKRDPYVKRIIKNKLNKSHWVPGHKSKAHGQPVKEIKAQKISGILKELGGEPMPEDMLDPDIRKMFPDRKFTVWGAALAMQCLKATRGYQDAAALVMERTEGKEALPISIDDVTIDIEGEENG